MSRRDITFEPDRFGRSGLGNMFAVRDEWLLDAVDYCIDAPEHIARGGLVSTAHVPPMPAHYVTSTVQRGAE